MEYITLAVAALAVLIAWKVYVGSTRSIEGIKKFTVDELAQFTKGNLATDKRFNRLEKADVARSETIKNIFKRISQLERKDMKASEIAPDKQPVSIDSQIQRRKDFGKRVRNIRNRKNMSQYALADKVQVFPSNVHAWENGVCLPRPDVLKELASALNTTPDFLLNGASIPPVVKAM